MSWVEVPSRASSDLVAALPATRASRSVKMFGSVAAKMNGHIFAGLFGRSTMVFLNEPERAAALALKGASMFDPMGDGRRRSDKVMLPEAMMGNPGELRRWIAKAFRAVSERPPKQTKAASARKAKVLGSSAKREGRASSSRPKPRGGNAGGPAVADPERASVVEAVKGLTTPRVAAAAAHAEAAIHFVICSARYSPRSSWTKCPPQNRSWGWPLAPGTCACSGRSARPRIGDFSPKSVRNGFSHRPSVSHAARFAAMAGSASVVGTRLGKMRAPALNARVGNGAS